MRLHYKECSPRYLRGKGACGRWSLLGAATTTTKSTILYSIFDGYNLPIAHSLVAHCVPPIVVAFVQCFFIFINVENVVKL